MTKKLYYGINFSILFLIVSSCLITTNWLYLIHEKYQFDLEIYVLELIWSWRFLAVGPTFEVLFNIIIGPAYLISFFLCRRNKFVIPYSLVIVLTLLLVQNCYYLTGFNVVFPAHIGGGGCGMKKEFIPLYFIPYYFEFLTLSVLYSYLFCQSRNKYEMIKFQFSELI